jgi:cytochrome c556
MATGLEPTSSLPRRRRAGAMVRAGVVAAVLATSFVTVAQDQRAATIPDVIFARKTLMNFMCDKLADIERRIALGHIDLDGERGTADAISVMFMAFPHLFPPDSNQWNPAADPDPAADTYASPELWNRYSDFYRLAAAAARSARDMSRADEIDEFKTHARELRIICDTCHALYSENQ